MVQKFGRKRNKYMTDIATAHVAGEDKIVLILKTPLMVHQDAWQK